MVLFKFPYDREYDNTRAADAAVRTGQEESERKGKGYTSHTFSRESLRALEAERRNIRARFVRKWSVHVEEVFKRRVLTSTYLHTSGPRKHLLKPVGFQSPFAHLEAD